MTEKILNRRGNAVSKEMFVPYGKQVLIKTVGMCPILEILNSKESINMNMNCFIVGMGDKVNKTSASAATSNNTESMYKLGDEVGINSVEEYVFKSINIPGTERTLAWYRQNENSPELIIAKAVTNDKAKSKLALNNSDILTGVQIDALTQLNIAQKHELFSNKSVEVISFYITNINNLTGVYVRPIKETEESSTTNR